MNYYMDTEFLEGTQEKRMFGIKYGQTKPTIDLISIALVAEDNREFYAISKDFNLKEAWNRFDLKVEKMYGDARNIFPDGRKYKEYWIRENVLKPIFEELVNKWALEEEKANKISCTTGYNPPIKFTYKNFRKLINKYGKTNKQIAFEIKEFVFDKIYIQKINDKFVGGSDAIKGNPEFYGYHADYDWVVFCWLFGKMNDLPNGFPMYCNDLKQLLDETQLKKFGDSKFTDGRLLNDIKELPNYPKLTDEHNALADSRFVRDLHEFLKKL